MTKLVNTVDGDPKCQLKKGNLYWSICEYLKPYFRYVIHHRHHCCHRPHHYGCYMFDISHGDALTGTLKGPMKYVSQF